MWIESFWKLELNHYYDNVDTFYNSRVESLWFFEIPTYVVFQFRVMDMLLYLGKTFLESRASY